ncbi:hypothetical protein POTOM_020458 [Populus tomentosa]|uniref:Cellulose synthase n=1 Tax=Populus tomentosa TaxID=118781 RepID=A0A8X8D0J2_POPTO|nr:hypothetical protein POTOM_020458 [Populus tomentosa]
MEVSAGLVAGSHNRNELVVIRRDGEFAPRSVHGDEEEDGTDDLENEFNFDGRNSNRHDMQHHGGPESMLHYDPDLPHDLHHPLPQFPLLTNGQMVDDIPPEQHALVPSYMAPVGGDGKRIHPLPFSDSSLPGRLAAAAQPRSLDPSKDLAAYGYGSIAWKERMESWKQKQDKLQIMKRENGDYDDDDPDLPLMDEARQPLSRKMPIPSSQINPYRMIIIIRLVVLGFFFHYRVTHPVNDAFALWLISVICEIWFAVSWILDQFPKWLPIDRETYLDRLSLRIPPSLQINMKGLDGIQGPIYVGTGCVFRRHALYGRKKKKTNKPKSELRKRNSRTFAPVGTLEGIEEGIEGIETENVAVTSEKKLENKFGQSSVFVASTLLEDGGTLKSASPASLLKEAIHVISCGYEDKTEWGKEVGWIYGSVTEDILTGFKMHCHGWRSIYCIPARPAFKGSAPINLSDRLHQVLRWALGSVEIFLSRHCPLWYGYGGGLKWLERLSYINATVYPLTSIPLLAYCTLPAVCLLTGKFITPELSNAASLWFLSLFICIFATSILEMRWSGVGIEEWWRNEQFWVIGGVSAHLFAVFQGLLKVLAGVDTNFTVTSKGGDDDEFSELYAFKWTTLLIPPTTLLIINLVGVVAGVSNAINNGYESWGPLFGKLFFAFWVIVHLYPFLKGLLGRQNRTPTIIIVWSILLASIFSLLWVRIDPFLAKSNGPLLEECGLDCN